MWDFASSSSNYGALREAQYQATQGYGWLTEVSIPFSAMGFETQIQNTVQYGSGNDYSPTNAPDAGGGPLANQAAALMAASDDMATLFGGMEPDERARDAPARRAAARHTRHGPFRRCSRRHVRCPALRAGRECDRNAALSLLPILLHRGRHGWDRGVRWRPLRIGRAVRQRRTGEQYLRRRNGARDVGWKRLERLRRCFDLGGARASRAARRMGRVVAAWSCRVWRSGKGLASNPKMPL